ncbi:MAG TPA: SRPBCC domain-containing protein [Ramlibacter sp.]|nr:SRPBCC domain-containing protein [Ramlibacter sp.]
MSRSRASAANLSPPLGMPGDDALVLTRVFDAPPEVVFSLWSDATHVKEWWRPAGYTAPEFTMDFRVGGTYRYCIALGGQQSWAQGEYRVIDPPQRIVMTFSWDSGDLAHDRETLITVTFAPDGEGATLMTFRQAPFESDAARHSHGHGWGQVLDAFGRFLTSRSST